jgi:hypothetical protein
MLACEEKQYNVSSMSLPTLRILKTVAVGTSPTGIA